MTEYYNHPGHLQYYCVDVNAEGVPGTSRDVNGALLYHVKVHNRSLPSAGAAMRWPVRCAPNITQHLLHLVVTFLYSENVELPRFLDCIWNDV